MLNTYDIFIGEDLRIAELIQQRRYQMLIHSCIYYELDRNLISDKQWDAWAKELVKLQTEYPEISKQVRWYEYFNDWDGTTGAFLPIRDSWVVLRAQQALHRNRKSDVHIVPVAVERKVEEKPKKQPQIVLNLF